MSAGYSSQPYPVHFVPEAKTYSLVPSFIFSQLNHPTRLRPDWKILGPLASNPDSLMSNLGLKGKVYNFLISLKFNGNKTLD